MEVSSSMQFGARQYDAQTSIAKTNAKDNSSFSRSLTNLQSTKQKEKSFLRNLINQQPATEEVEGAKNVLGKDDFLKILMTQLQNQDPSKPMEDKEFIAQMAQFSSLEQITNMRKGFDNLQRTMGRSFALSLIGKTVDIQPKDADAVRGLVSEVVTGENEQVKVNGVMYNSDDIIRVSMAEVQQ